MDFHEIAGQRRPDLLLSLHLPLTGQIRTVLRSWRILTQATVPEYCKLLIFESVFDPKGVPMYAAALDTNRTAALNGIEWTEEQ